MQMKAVVVTINEADTSFRACYLFCAVAEHDPGGSTERIEIMEKVDMRCHVLPACRVSLPVEVGEDK